MNRREILLRLLKQLRPAMWGIILFVILARFLNQAITLAILAMAAWGIGQVVLEVDAAMQAFFQSYFMITLVLLGLVKGIFFYLDQYVGASLALRLVESLRMQLYHRLEPLAPAGLMRFRSGDIISRAIDDVNRLEEFYAHTLGSAAIAVLIPLVALSALVWLNVWLALFFLPFVIAVALLVPWLSDDLGRHDVPRVRAATAELTAHMTDSIQGLREIVVFGQSEARRQEVQSHTMRLSAISGRLADLGGLHESLINTLVGVSVVGLLGLGLALVNLGQLPLVEVPAVLVIALATFGPMVGSQRNMVSGLNQAIASAGRLFAIIDQPPLVQETASSTPPEPVEPAISFSGVFFRYPVDAIQPSTNGDRPPTNGHRPPPADEPAPAAAAEPEGQADGALVETDAELGSPHTPLFLDAQSPPAWVLHDLNFTIPAGSTVALVGPSGAGKTTVVNLLLRFWDVDQGAVQLGGFDVREFPQEELRRKIAVVAQHTYIFSTTIRENLLIGNPTASDEAIERAARMANIHDFIASLADGYDTRVGEMGVRLSGGQRQRLAIARALLKDAPILVLDEATSNLDAVNEREIQSAIQQLMAGRTTLIIAHRLSTVVHADDILVLDRGQLVERGRHADLLAHGGVYARLFASQQDDLLLAARPEEEG